MPGSIGMAMFPEHGSTAESLLQHADVAMYQAKREGRNQFRVFDIKMLEREQVSDIADRRQQG